MKNGKTYNDQMTICSILYIPAQSGEKMWRVKARRWWYSNHLVFWMCAFIFTAEKKNEWHKGFQTWYNEKLLYYILHSVLPPHNLPWTKVIIGAGDTFVSKTTNGVMTRNTYNSKVYIFRCQIHIRMFKRGFNWHFCRY